MVHQQTINPFEASSGQHVTSDMHRKYHDAVATTLRVLESNLVKKTGYVDKCTLFILSQCKSVTE
jgi:hypothetical protein